jgi:predicted NUDIX family phosphoesterase
MKVLSLNIDEEFADLEFSTHELTIFRKCLAVVPIKVPEDIFDAIVYGVSRPEALQLAKLLAGILTAIAQGNKIIEDNQLIRLSATLENSCQVRIPLKTISGLQSVLIEARCGTRAEEIQEIINENIFSLQPFYDFLKAIIEELNKDRLSTLISQRYEQIQSDLDIINNPLIDLHLRPGITEKFCLSCESHTIEFSVHGHDKEKRQGFGLLSYVISENEKIIFASGRQWFRYSYLLDLIAYLELIVSSTISEAKLKQFMRYVFNARNENILVFQVLSKENERMDSCHIKIAFNLDPNNDRNDIEDKILIIENIIDNSEINSFTRSIKEIFARFAIDTMQVGASEVWIRVDDKDTSKEKKVIAYVDALNRRILIHRPTQHTAFRLENYTKYFIESRFQGYRKNRVTDSV